MATIDIFCKIVSFSLTCKCYLVKFKLALIDVVSIRQDAQMRKM